MTPEGDAAGTTPTRRHRGQPRPRRRELAGGGLVLAVVGVLLFAGAVVEDVSGELLDWVPEPVRVGAVVALVVGWMAVRVRRRVRSVRRAQGRSLP